jgi:pectate lyase
MAGSDANAAGAGGAASSSPIAATCKQWPASTGDEPVLSSIRVSGSYDGQLKRYAGAGALGIGGQEEGQDPLFLLSNGATLENVIIGAPGADGIHCQGSCTLRNVWWEDVGEDAATLKGSSGSQVMDIDCGGAKQASDKVFQHNGPGTIRIQNFYVEDFGKLYRSCGNCGTQHERHVEINGVEAKDGLVLAGVNTNYGDTAKIENVLLHGDVGVCDRYTGNSSGDEPKKTGSGADGTSCIYEESAIQRTP